MRIFGSTPLAPLTPLTPLTSKERWAIDAALDDAFAPLRGRSARVGPARVRAAVRWSAPEPARVGQLEVLRRISGLSLAAAVSAFILAGSLTPVPADSEVTRDAATSGARVLNGRLAYQPPVDPHGAELRATVGVDALNAAKARRVVVATGAEPVRPAIRNAEPFSTRP